MANPIFLSLVFNNHQPAGNFDFVNEYSYQCAYYPMVELLERYPAVHAGIHFSGSLLEWLAEHHPDLLARVKTLVGRGQVEILTGGYYAPILASLRDEDKLGQVQKLTNAIRRQFNAEPVGAWLAERVWEPYLAKPLVEAGVRYVIVDDTHFEEVGFDKEKDLFGYYITEEQGYKLAVFPTMTHLRYSIPWRSVDENIAWLYQIYQEGQKRALPGLVMIGDNVEKFGAWPGTHEHCWQNGYMDQLFAAIEQNADWLHTTTPAEFMRSTRALGRAYLPTASYLEMGEWSLPASLEYTFRNIVQDLQREDSRGVSRFVRGGIWRHFMIKYEEINRMHKRALQISKRVHAMPDGDDKRLALDLLWAAQSNDAYWHGIFGGIYLFHFRVANYANLIAAEMLANGENPPLTVEAVDVNLDNNNELVLSSKSTLMIFDLAYGGAIKEWDHRPARYNLLNLMTRRDEGYHQDLVTAAAEGRIHVVDPDKHDYDSTPSGVIRVKEPNLEQYLIVDWYCRGSFIDHFLRNDTTLEGFYRSAYPEQGDFVILPYQATWDVKGDEATIRLTREGHVWMGEDHLPVRVTKQFRVRQGQNRIDVLYTVQNLSSQTVDACFGIETALGYDGGNDVNNCVFEVADVASSLAEIAAHEAVTEYAATSILRGLRTEVTLSSPSNLWRFPLETVTLSEAGFERGYQGTVFLQWWPLLLGPGEEWQVSMTVDSRLMD